MGTHQVYNTKTQRKEFVGTERECRHYINFAAHYEYLQLKENN